jgi:hypothetical protein
MDTTSSTLRLVIAIGVTLSVLLGLILLITVQGLRRRLDQALTKADEAASQAQALRMELHQAKRPAAPQRPQPSGDATLVMSRPPTPEQTMVIKRR